MARYSGFLGRKVQVQYRAGDILLPASGTFVADSGRSIFLEQSLLQRGQQKHFRWEIPYQYLVRIEEVPEPQDASGSAVATASVIQGCAAVQPKAAKAAAATTAAMLPLNPPKPA